MPSVYDFTVQTITGEPRALEQYRGRALLIVNVASKCGLTPQYRGLEALHEEYGAKGLAVLGFPANDFGKQEPGSEAEIQNFCTTNYGVAFDMFAKVSVVGTDAAPLFRYLTDPANSPHGGAIQWNFNKFLLDRGGAIVARFEPSVDPTSREVRAAIEAALA